LGALYRRVWHEHVVGVQRHIILVRHGQYDETHRDDARRKLTPLGRKQAEITAARLASMLQPALTTAGREADVRIHVSSMTRAIETADIIASRLPEHVERLPPNPNLSEGSPAHNIPKPYMKPKSVHVDGARIEAAFRSLFYRARPPRKPKPVAAHPPDGVAAPRLPRHEYDIVVCHANVIRYFALRALQLPPEAWLRFAPYNCSITHLKITPAGYVSLYALGDVGHLPMEATTFSMKQGYEAS